MDLILAAKLRRARVMAGLSQATVAKKFNRYQSFVSKVENGERRVDIRELAKFASIYGKSVSFFAK